jgi:hypothetical protein
MLKRINRGEFEGLSGPRTTALLIGPITECVSEVPITDSNSVFFGEAGRIKTRALQNALELIGDQKMATELQATRR